MDPDNYLYHVTYYAHLGSIEEHGLNPEHSAKSIGGSALEAHKGESLFFTEAEGIDYWLSKSSDWAFHNHDEPMENGWIPVILRIPFPDDFEEDDDWVVDEVGEMDSGHDAFMIEASFAPDELELFYDGKWIPIGKWRDVDEEKSYDEGGYPVEDEENPFYWSP